MRRPQLRRPQLRVPGVSRLLRVAGGSGAGRFGARGSDTGGPGTGGRGAGRSGRGRSAAGRWGVGGSDASRARGLSGRALTLCVVALVLVLMLAAPVQRYLAHRSGVAEAQRTQQQLEQRLSDLQKQSKQWDDPAYIEQQARLRLQYVMPGDTVYQVVPEGSSGTVDDGTEQKQNTGTTVATTLPGDSWNQRLWGSIEAADQAG